MRMLVFFDLPVQTKKQRREATAFRNFLIKDGYHMLQYSVYARVCNGNDAVAKHRARLTGQLPANGAVRLLQQSIIPYQELLGNYNSVANIICNARIIPYQELLGNYNPGSDHARKGCIIPYQELLGNYNRGGNILIDLVIIPYQELLGNYNHLFDIPHAAPIIPYQELLGNYNFQGALGRGGGDYTIPRTVRELQPFPARCNGWHKLYHTKNC